MDHSEVATPPRQVSLLVFSTFFPGESDETYDTLLVSKFLDKLVQKGIAVTVLVPYLPRNPRDYSWDAIAVGQDSKSNWKFGLVSSIRRIRREYSFDAILAVNTSSLPFAGLLRLGLRLPVHLLSLGGQPLFDSLLGRGLTATAKIYGGLFQPIQSAILIDDMCNDSVQWLLTIRSTDCAMLELPIPHRAAIDVPARDETRRRLGLPVDTTILGWAARIDRVKAPEDFLSLARKCSDTKICFAMIAPKHGRDAMAAKYGLLPDNLILLPQMQHKDLAAFQMACDAFVSSSPVSVMNSTTREAMALGCPLITIGPERDLLYDQVADGHQVSLRIPRDWQLASRMVQDFLADDEKMREVACCAHKQIHSRGCTTLVFSERAARFLHERIRTMHRELDSASPIRSAMRN